MVKVYTEAEKEKFQPFLVKNFNFTAFNCMMATVSDEELGMLGVIVFLNKNLEKERIDFSQKDAQLAGVCSKIANLLFEIEKKLLRI